jgi:uncharacterized protein (DUF924 family)
MDNILVETNAQPAAHSPEGFAALQAHVGYSRHRELRDRRSAEPQSVIQFWRNAGPSRWFAKDASFDWKFRKSFVTLHEFATAGALAEWEARPDGALALLILLDQFPRNAFRGTSRMYATDDHARAVATRALALGHDQAVEEALRLFMYLPFAHSESLTDQDLSVELFRALGQESLSRAEHHRGIIERFGRFPHRNPILGRAMTPEEQRFLEEGGYSG